MTPQQVLRRPIITERASALAERFNQVAFEVSAKANKHQIRGAVETVYGVTVEAVRTMIVRGKKRRRGAALAERPNWKKALVTLKKGDTIDFFAAE